MGAVAICGMGVVCPLGIGHEQLWKNLLAVRHGVKPLSRFSGQDLGVHLAAEISAFDVNPYLQQRKLAKLLTAPGRYLVAAVHMALAEAGYLDPSTREHLRCGLIVGAGPTLAEEHLAHCPDKRHPLWYLETFPNLATSAVSINFNFNGYYNTIVSACASGTKAIYDAFALVRAGALDLVVVAATDSKITREHLAGFSKLGVLSKSNDPDTALRPFDRSRDGTVIGEGAGAIVLENYESAKKRNAPIYAIVAGGGATMDALSVVEPDNNGIGLLGCMKNALSDSGISAVSHLGYINAHGTSTKANDHSESRAIAALLGHDHKSVPVSATKSMTGHLTAASGLVEAIVCARTLSDQLIHPTRNFKRGDDDRDLDYVSGEARASKIKYALSNSAGFGGFNASIVLRAA